MASGGKSALSVLVDEKRVNDLLEQRSGLRAFIRQGCNTVLFMCFLALYTLLAIGEPFGDMRAFEGYVRRRFDTDAPMPLRNVDSASTFWQYTHNSLLPGLYGKDTAKYFFPGAAVATLLPIEGGNRLFGVVRVRMLKVKPTQDCSVPEALEAAFPPGFCYGPYAADMEETESFGPITNDGQKSFRYAKNAQGQSFSGEMGSYPQSGYAEVLTSNYGDTLARIKLLEANMWVSQATRVIFYEFTLYNFNLGLYAVCRISFEVLPSGLWHKTFDLEVLTQRHLTALGFGSTVEWLMLVGEVILVLFVLRYFLEEASELVGSSSKLSYFLDLWNILDLLNLVMIIATLGLRISAWAVGGGLQVFTGAPDKQAVDTFTDYSQAAQNVQTLRGLVAFNAVLTWFKTVKYYNVVPYIKIFMVTVSMSQKMLLSFVIIFLSVHYGLVIAYSVAFGQSLLELRTVWKANIYLMRVFLGDGNFKHILDHAPTIGPLLMILTVLGMIFILMNLFSAIMIRALADAKHTQDVRIQQQWDQFIYRAKVAWGAARDALKLDLRFRTGFPGLYSRWMRRKKKQDELEFKRDMAVLMRQQINRPDDLMALGPGSPTCGRRQKKALASVAIKDNDSDDGSEADLGPLFAREQLQPGFPGNPGKGVAPSATGAKALTNGSFGLPPLAPDDGAPQAEELDEEAQGVELLISASRHVAAGVVERTRGARGVLFGEMAESKEVLLGIGTVLQVLSQRARDLEAQQTDMLKHF